MIQYHWCDNNALENLSFPKAIQQTTELYVQFEYTTPETPQQNGYIKHTFTTLYGKTRAMMNQAEFTFLLHHKMWVFCADYATHLENMLLHPKHISTLYELFHGLLPPWLKYIQPFGSIHC
jgi:hypothetical protein